MDRRYGYYLRPSPAMCRAQVEIHQLLERQYGLRVAGRFMPHATIKGFFKTSAGEGELLDRLDTVAAGRQRFPVYSQGVVGIRAAGIALSIMRTPDLERNLPLQALHDDALQALLPVIDPDCAFTASEWLGQRFEAHLTLAMADIPSEHFTEILEFLQSLEPIGPERFLADTVHLYSFHSADWSGRWWESLDWTLLKSWRLKSSPG